MRGLLGIEQQLADHTTGRASPIRRKSARFALPILVVALGLLAPEWAAAQTCSSVTFERDRSFPVGQCMISGSSCSSDSQCGGDNDFCIMAVCSNNGSQFCTSDSQCGGGTCEEDVTFFFDKAYRCGQFVNGDHWIEADADDEVVITNITPPHTSACESGNPNGCRNGWYVNPGNKQRFMDGRAHATKDGITVDIPALPRTISATSGIQSAVKVISTTGNHGEMTQYMSLLTAQVLTIMPHGQIPASGDFRPGAWGTKKLPSGRGLYNVSEIQVSRIPSLALSSLPTPSHIPSKVEVARIFSEIEVGRQDRNSSAQGEMTVARACTGRNDCDGSISQYHGHRANRSGRSYLRLLFNDFDYVNSSSDRAVLHSAIQDGLDQYSAAFVTTNGNEKGFLIPVQFAAFVLNDSAGLVGDLGFLQDSVRVLWYRSPKYSSSHPGAYLWGLPCGSESEFIARYCDKEGNCSPSGAMCDKWGRDAYGYRDGVYEDVSYHRIHMGSHQGYWMLGALMQMKEFGNPNLQGFYHGFDRFFNGWDSPSFGGGKWMGLGVDQCTSSPSGPRSGNASNCARDGSCECTGGGGRSTAQHGSRSAYYSEDFAVDVAGAFASCADTTLRGSANSSFPCSGMTGNPGPATLPAPNLLPEL